MILRRNNKKFSFDLKKPLSTVQRRVRKILDRELVTLETHVNYEKFGFRTGLLHIQILDDRVYEIVKEVKMIDGIGSVEIHVGDSDIIAFLMYEDTQELLNILNHIKKIKGIQSVALSEKVANISVNEL